MQIKVSKGIKDIYKSQHKNYDYAIGSALDNFDPESFVKCFKIVKSFKLGGESEEISLGDGIVERIKSDLEQDNIDQKTIELLLWVGAILPEV